MEDEFSAESYQKARLAKEREKQAAMAAAAAADPELQAIREQTFRTQSDTVESSRNALRQLKETVQVSEATSGKLRQQGEQLERIEKTAERADENAQQSYESARDLHKYKGFLPVSVKNWFKGSKKKKEDKALSKTNKELDKELERKSMASSAASEIGSSAPSSASGPKRKEYLDEREQEIDENLDEMSSGLAALKAQAVDMNKDLDSQQVSMKRTEAYVGHTDYTLNSANRKIKEFM